MITKPVTFAAVIAALMLTEAPVSVTENKPMKAGDNWNWAWIDCEIDGAKVHISAFPNHINAELKWSTGERLVLDARFSKDDDRSPLLRKLFRFRELGDYDAIVCEVPALEAKELVAA